VWHTAVLAVGGGHITSDIAQVLRLPNSQAEEIKLQHGHTDEKDIDSNQYFNIKPFGETEFVQVSHLELVQIIAARVEEIFNMVVQEIKRSGYDGLLPAGMVLTGGSSQLPGMRTVASRVLGVPARIAFPENLVGMADRLNNPAYSTSVGLLHWASLMNEVPLQEAGRRSRKTPSSGGGEVLDQVRNLLKRLLP
jgi:cell division protein FtsA